MIPLHCWNMEEYICYRKIKLRVGSKKLSSKAIVTDPLTQNLTQFDLTEPTDPVLLDTFVPLLRSWAGAKVPEGNRGVILEAWRDLVADLPSPFKAPKIINWKLHNRGIFIGEFSTRAILFLLRDWNKYHSINQANALVPLITTRYIRNCRTRAWGAWAVGILAFRMEDNSFEV